MMPAGTVTSVDLGDGQRTTLEQWGERGPALIAVHGLTSSRKSWVRFGEHFAPAYRVFAYDQRGHGDSAGVAGPMTLERSVLDLEAVIRVAGGEVAAIVGHSWGGAVALLGGRRTVAERVIAIDPVIRVKAGAWQPLLADIIDDLEPVFCAAIDQRPQHIREIYDGLAPVDMDAKLHALRTMSATAVIRVGEDNHANEGGWDLRETVRDYPKPLLLALADPSDSLVLPEDAAFARSYAGPKARIELFAGEGHSLHRSAFERFAALTDAFLRTA
jgi:pimeloyl-ACP methyl ester carboxylesterase